MFFFNKKFQLKNFKYFSISSKKLLFLQGSNLGKNTFIRRLFTK